VIARAEQSGLLTIVTGARMARLEVDGKGLLSGARYVKDGGECFAPASCVLLASFTYENVQLLLLSTSKQYPHGLSNNHRQVGKHYSGAVTRGGRQPAGAA
jgi:gluconate 2-dehydrogenase alpha chain